MNKIFLYVLLGLFCLVPVAKGQQSYLYNKDVAVFYPANFDSLSTLPSSAVVKELVRQSALPDSWSIRPVYSTEKGKAVAALQVDSDADLYATGEVYGELRRNGKEVNLWNTDNFMYLQHERKQLYQSHPWVLGVRKDGSAFGLLADNSWKSYLSTGNPVKFTSEGPAFRVIVIEKNSPQEVMKELGNLIGTMEMPPLWALGYQQCRYSYYPDTRVKQIADEFRTRKIPCDVIWMDIDYMDGYRIFTFDSQRFPDPKGLNDYLHQHKFKAVYMIDPGVKKDNHYFVYKQGTQGDYWVKNKKNKPFVGKVWPGKCVFPDFTRPEVCTWWSKLYKDFMATGVDGVWNDMNEPAVFKGVDASMPVDNWHLGGGGQPAGPHLRYHNVYGLDMVKASREGILAANPDKRPFVLSRANFLGGQRYAATWTGDNGSSWEMLRASIPMTINLGLSGQPFNGPDIGGFGLNCNAELLAHWTAMGVYFPFVRNHSCAGTVDQEPWVFGTKVENVCRTAIERRYRILPYVYTLFWEASTDGLPIMRPVFMADTKDLSLRSEQQCFMLGTDLLIIPRWSKNPQLPKGNWNIIKFENEDDGYQPYVALRPGAILPVTKVIQSTEDYKTDSLTLLINPDKTGYASGRLYDDAGNGFGYRSGDYSVYKFVAGKCSDKQLKIEISSIEGTRPANRVYRVGYVTDNNIVYSDWSSKNVIYVDIQEDNQEGIDLKKLKMSTMDLNEQPAAIEKVKKTKAGDKDKKGDQYY
ncbi:TIM-barrel domain-containing protein [uncultured Bacteroides sp.]|uniref:TIM-barrel domain-containing protein n=1 Tax=uncultured Bacteroides sp. TaxID=162156 RepID=UPI002AA8206A|nr:TIM-barrel domain-containing protein [uncultured Bacteroides sp.]